LAGLDWTAEVFVVAQLERAVEIKKVSDQALRIVVEEIAEVDVPLRADTQVVVSGTAK
jgi:hypothetical protein